MAGSGEPEYNPVPSVSVGSLDPGANTQTGSALLGNIGGRLMKYSSHRGGAQAPEHVTRKLVVYDYYDGAEGGDAYIDVSVVAADGSDTYLGPLFGCIQQLTYNKWFPSTDWTTGLMAIFYDDRTSESGAGGQYGFVKGRPADNPNRLTLFYPLPVAPVAGDKFVLGGQLSWITFSSQQAPPFSGDIQAQRGEIWAQQRLGSSDMRIELYPSGESFIPNAQLFPFRLGAIWLELTESEREQRGIQFAGLRDELGRGSVGHEIRPSIADIVNKGQDYLIDALNIEYVISG